MSEGVTGVDVIIKIGEGSTAAILGQRGAKLTSSREKVDFRVKTSYPNPVYQYGWMDGSIDCDGLLMIGAGGFASLYNQQLNGTIVDIEFTIGDTGEVFSGKALLTNVSMDAPQDKEGTMSCKLEQTDAWSAVSAA